jgi:hypothetical protein
LFQDDHPKLPDNAWLADFEDLVNRFTPADDDRLHRKSPAWLKHEGVLLGSSFARLERVSVIEKRRLPIDVLVDRAFSRSSTTRERLGDKADELAAEIRSVIGSRASEGAVDEVVEASALIARRQR